MRNKLVIIIALIFGLITAYLVFNYLEDMKATLDDNEYQDIVVVNQDIPINTTITSNMVNQKKIPSQYVHSQEIKDKAEVIGKVLLVPLNSGQSIMKNQVIGLGEQKEGLAYLIPEGKRALTIPVDEVSGIAGLIKPGDHVDIISTITIGDDKPITYTLVILQDIEVLATGRTMDKNINAKEKAVLEAKTATLAVSLAEAKPLMMASQRGVLRLMLRSPIDNSKGYTPPFVMEDFLAK